MRRRWISLIAVMVGAAALLWMTAPVLAQAAAPVSTVQISGQYGPGHMPPNISNERYAHQADTLINFLHIFMLALFVGWGAFFVYCLIRFRRRPGHSAESRPVKAKISKWLEVGVAVIEAVLLVGISMPAWASYKHDLPSPADKPVHVRVLAEQFAWNFHYPGKDGVYGVIKPELIDLATNPVGRDMSDPHSADDVVSQELHVPVDRPVIAEISSKDVIHSFFIPVLRIKQDAIPGMRIPVWFEAGETGNYEIACAQLCGNNHYSMRAILVVESPEDFEAWMAEKSKGPELFDEDL